MIVALIISRFQVLIPLENLLPLFMLGAIMIPFAQLSIGHGTRLFPLERLISSRKRSSASSMSGFS